MNKKYFLVFAILALIFAVGLDFVEADLHQKEALMPPWDITSYVDQIGYFSFDPTTILATLHNQNSNVFIPIPEDEALDREGIADITVYWTQADFMEIVRVIYQQVWQDSMDLQEWSIHSIYFRGDCHQSCGLYSASIAFFRKESNRYETRLIEIEPYFGWARWGGQQTYPRSLLSPWKSVDFLGSKVPAEEALRIANEEIKTNLQIQEDRWDAFMGVPLRNDFRNWRLYIFGDFPSESYVVHMKSGNIRR